MTEVFCATPVCWTREKVPAIRAQSWPATRMQVAQRWPAKLRLQKALAGHPPVEASKRKT